jgi:NAD(P)-dependent dehydrogenase (short-subunit alcohol dehydrogenase family)
VLDPEWLARLRPARLFSLDGQTTVVTGAAGGVGRWLCAGFGIAGAKVVATDSDGPGLEALQTELGAVGLEVLSFPCDLATSRSADRIVQAAVDWSGRVDVLVNNAGVNRRIPMLEVTTDLLHEIWEIDYIRCYELSQAAARVMTAQGGGAIIHIGSVNNQVGLEDVSMLGPTKAALSQLAKGMAIELAHVGIRTNVLAPGFMDTPMNQAHWTDETRGPWIFDRTPMSRPGHPAELVGAALLLASAAGSFITGQTVYVDGGFTAGSRWNVPAGSGVAGYEAWRSAGSPIPGFDGRAVLDHDGEGEHPADEAEGSG